MAIPTADLCDRYAALYPGAVTDALDAMGYGSRALPSTIGPLTPDTQMAGVAYPIHGYPDEDCDYDANMRRFLRMLGDAPADSVVAYQTRDEEAAHIGELSTTALQSQGCRGAVVDGGARDTRFIVDQGFPVFTRYRTPADAPPRWRLAEWDVPVTIGAVEVRPGDVLVGDVDGVICVPQDVRDEVLERAEETVDTEDQVRDAIRDGVDPLAAYEEFGEF
jgi:4-hydroxy-4-methyl-2-oxoglutarate aldolase